DALFVPLFGLPAGHRSRIVPSKTYEYLASGRPILGTLPEGDARELVERSGRGVCANPCDDAAIADALVRAIDLAQSTKNTPLPMEPWVGDYDWRPLCRKFFAFLDRCLTETTTPLPV